MTGQINSITEKIEEITSQGYPQEQIDCYGREISTMFDKRFNSLFNSDSQTVYYVERNNGQAQTIEPYQGPQLSFDRMAYEDFIKRAVRIKEVMGIDDIAYQIGNIRENNEKGVFTMDTSINFKSRYSSSMKIVLDFMSNITKDPYNALSCQKEDIIESARILKAKGMNIRDLFGLRDIVNKEHELDFMIYYDGSSIIFKGWENEMDSNKSYTKKHSIRSMKQLIKWLNKNAGLEIDHKIISEIRHNYRTTKINGDLNNLSQFRKWVQIEKKEPKPIYRITPSTEFNDALKILSHDLIFEYFPFKSDVEKSFLLQIIRNNFNIFGIKNVEE